MPPHDTHRFRRILQSPSASSLTSSLSSLSLYTSTSNSTSWGPGALAGKAIKALGKSTVRGVEHVVIKRRMATICANLPQVDNYPDLLARPGFWQELFNDVLELSRPGLYDDQIHLSAMRIILAQIGSYQTKHLIHCLSGWLLDDLMQFLTNITSVALFCCSGFLEPKLTDAYLSQQSYHNLDPHQLIGPD
ncbi:hypothetical protein MIND_01333900 [Mycena indigotica]|uniref:Uncharacterized protein n=1 Tax=Mycena indigotica TaxID=2126181 RepID=A0A8H6VQQ4_9AGAR|nr:uncharacterized protein MIND_01333900 [Mycena indigotica]KAF7290204.1 hypothetical protein MIND_01333900 [Mycena indigotica]